MSEIRAASVAVSLSVSNSARSVSAASTVSISETSIARHFLCDATDAGAVGQGDRAGLQRQLAPDQAKERGLAGAIAPDDAHFMAIGDRDTGVLDQRAASDRIGDIINAQHDGERWRSARGLSTAVQPVPQGLQRARGIADKTGM